MMFHRKFHTALALVLAGMAGVTAIAGAVEATKEKPLYDRLGGKGAITAVVDTFVGHVAADKRINGYFASTDIPRLKTHLVNQICEASGGPCTYTGRTMKETHAGMGVTETAFGALVENLVKALERHQVGKGDQEALLAILGPMKPDIVETK